MVVEALGEGGTCRGWSAGNLSDYLNAIELVSPGVPGQALAYVTADHVNAARVGVAVVAVQTARRLALVHIWNHHQINSIANCRTLFEPISSEHRQWKQILLSSG